MKTIILSQKLIKFFIIVIISLPLTFVTVKGFSNPQIIERGYFIIFDHSYCLHCGNCLIWCDTFLIFNKDLKPIHKVHKTNEFMLYLVSEINDVKEAYWSCPTNAVFY